MVTSGWVDQWGYRFETPHVAIQFVICGEQYMLITGEELLTDKQRMRRDMFRISKSVKPRPLMARPVGRLQVILPPCLSDS